MILKTKNVLGIHSPITGFLCGIRPLVVAMVFVITISSSAWARPDAGPQQKTQTKETQSLFSNGNQKLVVHDSLSAFSKYAPDIQKIFLSFLLNNFDKAVQLYPEYVKAHPDCFSNIKYKEIDKVLSCLKLRLEEDSPKQSSKNSLGDIRATVALHVAILLVRNGYQDADNQFSNLQKNVLPKQSKICSTSLWSLRERTNPEHCFVSWTFAQAKTGTLGEIVEAWKMFIQSAILNTFASHVNADFLAYSHVAFPDSYKFRTDYSWDKTDPIVFTDQLIRSVQRDILTYIDSLPEWQKQK